MIGVKDGDQPPFHSDQALFAKLAQCGADRFTATADQVGHFLMGELYPQADVWAVPHAIGLAEFEQEMGQAGRHVAEDEVFHPTLNFAEPKPDELRELH